jgi:hypothetical protein
MPKTIKAPQKRGSSRALAILRKVKLEGPEARFKGKTDEEIIRAIKKTRQEIWRKKIASRPGH